MLFERLIENDLLSDVVQRFRRAVNTMNKIDNLAKISASDCKLFDDLMSKYSRYEHSQPKETPIALPEPDDLQQDIDFYCLLHHPDGARFYMAFFLPFKLFLITRLEKLPLLNF